MFISRQWDILGKLQYQYKSQKNWKVSWGLEDLYFHEYPSIFWGMLLKDVWYVKFGKCIKSLLFRLQVTDFSSLSLPSSFLPHSLSLLFPSLLFFFISFFSLFFSLSFLPINVCNFSCEAPIILNLEYLIEFKEDNPYPALF